MSIHEIIAGGGGLFLVLMTLIEIAPIKVNPWSTVAKLLGNAINADVMKKLGEIESANLETRKALTDHIKTDDERAADGHRQRILRFNDELKRGLLHTEEHYKEVLRDIDKYNAYCESHKEYKNSCSVHAIANIERSYDDRLRKHDFL